MARYSDRPFLSKANAGGTVISIKTCDLQMQAQHPPPTILHAHYWSLTCYCSLGTSRLSITALLSLTAIAAGTIAIAVGTLLSLSALHSLHHQPQVFAFEANSYALICSWITYHLCDHVQACPQHLSSSHYKLFVTTEFPAAHA